MRRPLLLLHLSDLHFGAHGRFAGQDMRKLATRFQQAVDEARAELGFAERVGLVVVTGDIAEAARPREYAEARAFFEALVGTLGLPRRAVVFAPGNHDVSWVETRKVVLDQDLEGFDDEERDRRIQAVKLRHFEAFLQAFYGKDEAQIVHSIGHQASVHVFPELAVAVAALSSCERESHLAQGGALGEAQAQALMGQWRAGDAARWLKIVAIHHNPVATVPAGVTSWVDWLRKKGGGIGGEVIEHFVADAVGFEGRERLRAVAEDCRVPIILHGHHHAADSNAFPWRRGGKGQTLVLSAGSWGLLPDKLPEGQPAMMHLLRIDAAREEARSVLRMYEPRARAEGAVTPGHFVVDAANPEGATLHLSLPAELLRETIDTPPPTSGSADLADFVSEYRAALGRTFERWDLGGIGAVQPGGPSRPVEARLDDMYLPLRLGEGIAPDKPEAGSVLGPEALLARGKPLVLRGSAGSGKTTWMRWTFRRLLEMPGALPFMVELRRLSHAWAHKKPQGGERTLEAYLRDVVAEAGVGGWEKELPAALGRATGPRPVLLVDGWDELGELGEELREKLLQFLARNPRVLAVVTSRPYGQSRPTGSEGFEVLDIQPLADAEIAAFSRQFHARVYGEDERAADVSSRRFLSAVDTSPEAKSLARTALLLTMMLLISRDRPLPDKRHKLYEECLRNLLSARPERKEREGAQITPDQWRPRDSEVRLRAVAELSFRMQSEGYARGRRASIVRAWDDLARLLPGAWSSEERRGFLAWLVASAGVMVDRADGTLSFTHLSFQEYLAAHHLAAVTEGAEARNALCRERMHDVDWWETLRLWAAIVEDRNPTHLEPVLDALIDGEAAGFWLSGAMLADGLGGGAIERYCDGLSRRFHVEEREYAAMAARAFAGSQQAERRELLGKYFPKAAARLRWLPAIWADSWQKEARIPGVWGQSSARPSGAPLVDPALSEEEDAFEKLSREAGEGQGVGRGRALGGSNPLWPGAPLSLVLLRVWPSQRARVATRLQTLISLGGEERLRALGERVLRPSRHDERWVQELSTALLQDLPMHWAHSEAPDWAKQWAEHAGADWPTSWARDWATDLARAWAVDWVRYWPRDWWRFWTPRLARYLARDWSAYRTRAEAERLTRSWAMDWPLDLKDYWVRDWAQDLALPEGEPWTLDFATAEIAAVGHAGTRVALAFSALDTDPLARLFRAACRLSIRPRSDSRTFRKVLEKLPAGIDPLWPALARHLCRRATPEDRALLEDLARHPDKRAPPLSWGLRYLARGDLVLDDGSELGLDALCDELGLPHLPYLEEMPPELVPSWDGKR